MIPGITILPGDCLASMRTLPDCSVDAVVTDPPYGQTSLPWDRFVYGWMAEIGRILKPTGSVWVFGTLRMFTQHWREFEGWTLAQDIVWEKHNGSSLRSDRFRRVHEQAAQFYRGEWGPVYKGMVVTMDAAKRTLSRRTGARHQHLHGAETGTSYASEDGGPRIQRSVIYARSEHGRAVHPTQKPTAIIEPLILNACPPGGVVLDPFAGSGTTGGCAVRLGRRAILCEGNQDYLSVMERRISGIVSETSDLFARAAE
ncbi:site-specific DNA-methyltransferase [Cereibacter sphaeroides]|uniref:Methyltransferase n=1 Tax=Cereibacter sphaeroides TaxID=1063 RepID=A0AAX1UND5_CERSP|nr:site-specific DNA-methyltransferase [Cereibacter sphaeroides]RHZ96501.1 site-specific DNA-methyltransferase [Cereibacter sphaeroides]